MNWTIVAVTSIVGLASVAGLSVLSDALRRSNDTLRRIIDEERVARNEVVDALVAVTVGAQQLATLRRVPNEPQLAGERSAQARAMASTLRPVPNDMTDDEGHPIIPVGMDR